MSFSRTDITQLRSRLKQAGIWAQKSLGQHFLIDTSVLAVITEAAKLQATDLVVEIGPGPGVLTEQLLAQVKQVIAFEYDPGMVEILREDFPNLEIVQGNVLYMAPERLKEISPYKVVANVPYNITNPLLRLFLEATTLPRPISLTLMLQQEVAARLAAAERQEGRGYLSVLTQYFSEVQYIQTVPASAFWPEPKIKSAIIHLTSKQERLVPEAQEQNFLRFVHQLFIQPRKQLKNVVAGIQGVEALEIAKLFATFGWSDRIRAQELSLEQWVKLYQVMKLQ